MGEVSDYKCISCEKDDKCSCGGDMWLLQNNRTLSNLPSFFICFKCGFVGEVGIGKVLKYEVSP